MKPIQQRILYAILILYLLLGVTYSLVTPLFEASDELWHYPMVKYLADNRLQLPPQDPANPGTWRQEGSQPPLYYLLAAILTAGIDTSDMEAVRRINPHADIGIVRPDGNANMIAHRADAEAFPWRGTALAVRIARLFSVALGLGTTLVTFWLAREIFPEWPSVALGAAALNAFLPMFLFISGSVNNDNLSNLLGNLLTLQIVRLIRTQPHWRQYAAVGVVAGAGLLAKLNIGFLIPLVGLALLIVSWRQRDWRPLIIGGAISGGLTIAIAGWWYWHNYQLYGDPSGINRFLEMVGRRAIPANAAQLWSERHSFTQAYWGFFGGMNVPLPEIIYLIFNVIGGAALLSAVIFIGKTAARREWPLERWLPAAVTIAWPIITFVSFLRWTAETPASQGRLVFGALSSLSLWMAVGLIWWLPARLRPVLIGAAASYFAAVAVLTPFLVIAPVYALPQLRPAGAPIAIWQEADDGGAIGLDAARIITTNVQPETYAQIELDLQVTAPLSRDWSLFVHLVTPDGVIVAQRDVYPGGGRLATSDLSAGTAWTNPVAVWIPSAAYAPMSLAVETGWYDLASGERLRLADGGASVRIGTLELHPRADTLGVPNPVRVNFGGEIELVGYSLSDLSPAAGDAVTLTLYWRGLTTLNRDYKVFANILDVSTLTKHAASDGMPVNWQAPTSTWQPGAIIADPHTLSVVPNAPPGIYSLEIGLYWLSPDGSLERLRVVTPDGGMAEDFIYLSRVRIIPAETS